jgi:hypothetical protein
MRHVLPFRTSLVPKPPPVPFREILRAWAALSFRPTDCRIALERIMKDRNVPEGLLDPSAITQGGRPATDELLVGWQSRKHSWIWGIETPAGEQLFEVPAEAVASIANLIRVARDATTLKAFFATAFELGHDRDIVELFASSFGTKGRVRAWPSCTAPGLYRREHASVLIKTQDTLIVTDPQSLSSEWTTNYGAYPSERTLQCGHVLITHSHTDHWHMPSTIRWARDTVIVPRVKRPNLLSDDLHALLSLADQVVIAPEWRAAVEIGDVKLDVLPFFGEQPTRTAALPCGVRNWGNCYRLTTREWSAVILADSGTDAEGTMSQVIKDSVEAQGPVDFVLSCCYEFPEVINEGLPHYLFTLPFEELSGYLNTRASITAGPSGVADVCDAAQARWFLPYAHGFHGVGKPAPSLGGGMSETVALAALERELTARRVATKILRWNPGDHLTWGRKGPQIHPVRS